MIKSIYGFSKSQIEIKKSKFIANIFYVEKNNEVIKKIENIRNKYSNAKHNVYAYRLYENNYEKFSEDGEPQGTAGATILDILRKKNLQNILVVVTRYFGGILLGTGGLVKAYTDVCLLALENNAIIEKEKGTIFEIDIEYSNQKELEYFCKKNSIKIISKEYLQNVKYQLSSTLENKKILESNVKITSIKTISDNIFINL